MVSNHVPNRGCALNRGCSLSTKRTSLDKLCNIVITFDDDKSSHYACGNHLFEGSNHLFEGSNHLFEVTNINVGSEVAITSSRRYGPHHTTRRNPILIGCRKKHLLSSTRWFQKTKPSFSKAIACCLNDVTYQEGSMLLMVRQIA